MIGWVVSIGLLLFDLFIIYPNMKGDYLPKWFNILYQTFSRTLWGVCLAFIIYACSSSNGGMQIIFIYALLTLKYFFLNRCLKVLWINYLVCLYGHLYQDFRFQYISYIQLYCFITMQLSSIRFICKIRQ